MKSEDKLPKTAMGLYVKLYCNKISKKKNKQFNLTEAIKSWVSLSKTDKKYFLNVYKTYETKVNKHIASNLQKTLLYMKKKDGSSKRLSKSSQLSTGCNQQSVENQEISKENSVSVGHDNYDNNEIVIQKDGDQLGSNNTATPVENLSSVVNLECNVVEPEPDTPRFISEPTPPIRSSMELFETIKNNTTLKWSDLSKVQKQRYQRAVLCIKKNYLKQYTAYLEQLEPERLFYHYKTKL